MKLRRALATGLWSCENGVLWQFRSLDASTVTALRFNGITSYFDVVSSSEDQLEKITKRRPPFGKNLRQAVQQTLAGALKVSAEIEFAAGSTVPSEVICHVDSRFENDAGSPEVAKGDAKVTYTLIAYTDQSDGCLLYRQKINQPAAHRAPIPSKFGKIYVNLISSMVGLDGK